MTDIQTLMLTPTTTGDVMGDQLSASGNSDSDVFITIARMFEISLLIWRLRIQMRVELMTIDRGQERVQVIISWE